MLHSGDSTAFVISEDEYVRANRLYSRPTRGIWVFYGVLAAILIAVFSSSGSMKVVALGGAIGGTVGVLVTRYLFAPWLVRRHYRAYEAVHEQQSVELTEGGVRFQSENGEALIPWRHIWKWRENEEFVLIYQNQRLYHLLPRSLAQRGFDFARLEALLKEHVGSAT